MSLVCPMMQQQQRSILLSGPPPSLSSSPPPPSSQNIQSFSFSAGPVPLSVSLSLLNSKPQSQIPDSYFYPRRRRQHHHHHSSFITAAAPLIVKNTITQGGGGGEPVGEEEEHFIEVGYISKVHGLHGELRVHSTTDFPQLRFAQRGKRWLRTRVSGKEMISQMELTEGRDHPGQKSWIISLRGIDTVDQAKQLVGSTLLVKEEDRPDLEEGEFYTPDLVGMRVVLKETGELVGVVANVFNHGASDLLQVMLTSTKEKTDHLNASSPDIGSSGQVVWVPFVEAIVPEVDLERREMFITPPKGLLELNIRKDVRSKKERRHLEWQERKKVQHRLTAVKRILSEMQQHHLLECLKGGEKTQKQQLIKQVVNINFKLLRHALQSIDVPLDRFNLSEFIVVNSGILQKNSFKISSNLLSCCASKDDLNHELHKEGIQLLMKSKAAIVFISNDEVNMQKDSEMNAISISTTETKLLQFQELILYYQGLLKVEGQSIPIPLILVAPTDEMKSYEELLLRNDHFGLDSQKVWLLEEEKLPIVSLSLDSKKILTKSSHEILLAPTGSGGVFSLIQSHGIADKLIEMSVEYVQVCCLGGRPAGPATESIGIGSSSLLFGLVKRWGADVGISVKPRGEIGEEAEDEEFNIVLSMNHLDKMCKQHYKLVKFMAVPEQHAHVELVQVDGKFVEEIHPIPNEPNSYRLHSSIYTALNACSLDSICIMHLPTSCSD